MLQPSMGGRATVKKALAGKSAKMLDSTEALNLRAKAAFDHSQRQEQRKPAAKRCVCKPGYCSVCVCVCVRACVCVCVCVSSNLSRPCRLANSCTALQYSCTIAQYIATPHCKIAIPHRSMLA